MEKKMLKILRRKRFLLMCFCITFFAYLILNSFQQKKAAADKQLREQEEYHHKLLLLDAQPYNSFCELAQLEVINHENTLPKKRMPS